MDKIQIRTIFLFQFKLGRKAAETAHDISDAFGTGTADERVAQRWFKKFRNRDESLEDEGRGRPTAVDNEHLKVIIEADPRKTTREVVVEIEVDHSTVVRHLKQIGKSKKLDKWVPHELNDNKKNRRFEVSSTLLLRNKNDPFLERIVTCHDPLRQPATFGTVVGYWRSSITLPEAEIAPKKVMVTVWWSAAGFIHHSFLNPGETITAEKYCRQIDEMHQKLQRICRRLVNMKGSILLHDNARLHVAQLTLQKLNKLGYETLPHPPYSPDLSPTDYHFFKHLDNFLREKCFKNRDDAESAFNDFIASRTPDFYANGINRLVSSWQKCVDSNGSYFN